MSLYLQSIVALLTTKTAVMTAVTALLHALVQACILLLSSDETGCRKVLCYGMHEAAMTVEWGWQCLHTMLMLSGLMQLCVCCMLWK